MPGDIQDIFLNPIRFLRGKPYNIKMQVSINEHVIPEITVILFTRGLLYVRLQCTKNRLTCENYIANYKFFQEHQLNSKRFPGVVDPSLYRLTLTQLKQISYITVLVTHL